MQTAGPSVVIVGAGFGGLFAARALADAEARVLLIDRHNYHLFQPLLYQVATAGLAPSDIAWPVRSIVTKQRNTSVLLAEVRGIDRSRKQVLLDDGAVDYDRLVLATGARHAYFGHEEWREYAPGLKSIDDATMLRRKLLLAFEQAESCTDPEQRTRLLQFVIVGAGPTGVELAGAIAELAHHTLAKDFRRIDPRSARIVLVEAGPRVLPTFSEPMSLYAKESLKRLGVEVRTGSAVSRCDAEGVSIGDGHREERIAAATVLWAAGVAASPVGAWLGLETDRQGRIGVMPELSIEGDPSVFVIGDAARVTDSRGAPVPGTAPAAKQQGRYVARVIRAGINRDRPPPPFRYRHVGNLATIGRRSAVVELGRVKLKGRLAWWLWGIAHIYFLIGLPSPFIVSFRWLWEYLTYGKGARLITGRPRD
jgi:NADH:quinone reductase (non-electrogenic)